MPKEKPARSTQEMREYWKQKQREHRAGQTGDQEQRESSEREESTDDAYVKYMLG